MATRRKSSVRRIALIVVITALVALACWFGWQHLPHRLDQAITTKIALATVSADRIDPVNEGRRVRVAGQLEIGKPPRDAQLGIAMDAAILFRHVEMYQWREQCAGGNCRYDTEWSAQPIDSHKFRTPAGHENPAPPFASAHFDAGEIRLGAFTVDPELAAAQLNAADYPVHAASLPPNLAASFRDVDGVLYAGGDPAHPVVGALRVSYRIMPIGAVILTGVQRGAKLTAN